MANGKKRKQRELNALSGFAAFNTGREGERAVKEALPELVHINRPGADFMTRDGKHFVEVKTTIAKNREESKILLKCLNNEWMNEIADTLVIVTRKQFFFCRAEELRKFVKENYSRFRTSRHPRDARERLFVPITALQEAGFLHAVERKKATRQNFNWQIVFNALYPKERKPRTMQQRLLEEVARKAFFAAAAKARNRPNNGTKFSKPLIKRVFPQKTVPRR